MGSRGMSVRCHMRSAAFSWGDSSSGHCLDRGPIQVLRFSLSVAATESDHQVSELLVVPVVVYREAGQGQVI